MIHSPSVTKILGSTRLTIGEPVDPPQGTERIVLAEDDPGVRKATLLILEDLGYEVLAYPSGPDVLEALAKDDRPVELLLTDFDMPDLNGYELAQRLLALRPDARVLLTSGLPEKSILPRVKPASFHSQTVYVPFLGSEAA